VVVYSGPNNSGYGNLLIIDHGNDWQSVYGHLDRILVTCGESVAQGQEVALLGSTGNSSGPHLHFELRHDGYVNPWDYLTK
jgi:murein DD-endopeptidase MepM/ murein hydrolase activator NlpD